MVPISPSISICIPTHALTPQILRCLRVLSFDKELLKAVEVIIVYDGQPASDMAFETASENGVDLRQYSMPKAGPAAARNLAAKQARTSNLIFCDSDVIFTLEAVRAAQNAQLGELTVPKVLPIQSTPVSDFFSEFVFAPRYENGKHYAVSAFWIMHRDDFESVNGFDERFAHPAGEDMDFMRRWNDSGRRVRCDESLVVLHKNPTTIPQLSMRAIRYGRHGNAIVPDHLAASALTSVLTKMGHFLRRIAAFSFALVTGRGAAHVHKNRLLTVIWMAAWQYGHLTRPRR